MQSDDSTIPAVVLQHYGATMLAVQAFERSLALHAMTLTREKSQRILTNEDELRRALAKIANRIGHAFQRASASEMRKLLPADFDPSLMSEMVELIPVRNSASSPLPRRARTSQHRQEPTTTSGAAMPWLSALRCQSCPS
jgi:hypothetical protein